MALPDVKVTLSNGALGGVGPSKDGIAALMLSGTTLPDLALATPKVIFSLEEAIALGLDENATGANLVAYRHIKEFYQGYRYITGSGVAELYIMTVADTMTLTEMADITEASGAKKLLNFADSRVRLIGFTRHPDVGYTPTLTSGIDQDSIDALQKAHELGNSYASDQAPLRSLVEARAFVVANIGNLMDLRQSAYNRSGAVILSTKNDGSASAGLVLGIAAGLAVQRSIARVRNGALPITDAYVGDTKPEAIAGLATISDKAFIAARTFPNRSGYYITDDPMAAPKSDDYSQLARGRVIDKAHRIAYNTYVDELNDDVEIDQDTGQLPTGYIAYLKQRIVNNISLLMDGEISGLPIVFIDPSQNILANGKLKIQLRIVPVGYNKHIEIDLGFTNPLNN